MSLNLFQTSKSFHALLHSTVFFFTPPPHYESSFGYFHFHFLTDFQDKKAYASAMHIRGCTVKVKSFLSRFLYY